jgi:hypothetical protein
MEQAGSFGCIHPNPSPLIAPRRLARQEMEIDLLCCLAAPMRVAVQASWVRGHIAQLSEGARISDRLPSSMRRLTDIRRRPDEPGPEEGIA